MLHRIRNIFLGFIILGLALGCLNGCDSVDKTLDEATGNRALKQYQETKEKLKTIDEQQKEKYKTIPGDETQENK